MDNFNTMLSLVWSRNPNKQNNKYFMNENVNILEAFN